MSDKISPQVCKVRKSTAKGNLRKTATITESYTVQIEAKPIGEPKSYGLDPRYIPRSQSPQTVPCESLEQAKSYLALFEAEHIHDGWELVPE